MAFRLVALALSLSLLVSASARESGATAKTSRVDFVAAAQAAFYVRSDLPAVLATTASGLKSHPGDPELLFLRMEAAALEADSATTLESAVQLCKSLRVRPAPRGFIAATQILDLAGNTVPFRAVVPKIQRLIAAGSPYGIDLRSALVQAAADGIPNLPLLENARAAGLITDWRIAGPFGKYSYAEFDRAFPPERDFLKPDASGNRLIEPVRYEDGSLSLPQYFPRTGVFYAAANIRSQQNVNRILRVDSPGTLEVFLDGKSVLRKDDRFREGADVATTAVHLTAGSHILLLKFVPEAQPIRVALLPQSALLRSQPIHRDGDAIRSTEAVYISALLASRSGDYQDAIAQLTPLHNRHAFAAGDLLLAQSWAQISDGSPEELAFLTSTLKLAPQAAIADFLLAARANDNGHTGEAWQRVSRVVGAHPEFAAAQHLAARIAIPHSWTVEAISALDAEIAANPTCEALLEAYRFYAGHQQFQRAKTIENRIDGCAPESIAYTDLLSSAGRHAEAAQAAGKLVATNPFSRKARESLVRELALAGKNSEAHQAAVELAHLAPNSEEYQRLASASPDTLAWSDDDSNRARDFANPDAFYSPYRRDALAIAREQTPTQYAGLSAVTLIDDKSTRLTGDGFVSVYLHRMLRVLTREGVDEFGEVALPDNADILELRTLKGDGTFAEPEFSRHKDTISMPALNPGDTIDVEYIVRYPQGGVEAHRKDFSFVFGSFTTPVADARFVALTPVSVLVTTRQLAGAPAAQISAQSGERVQIWEQQNLPQYSEEKNVPNAEILPTVKLYEIPNDGWQDIRQRYREQLLRAARIGPRVQSALDGLQIDNLPAEQRLSRIYDFVSEHIRDDQGTFADYNVTSAEDTLADGSGNRTATLIALARAAGLEADLLLARNLSAPQPVISEEAFTQPLVRVRFPLTSKSVVLDLLSPGMSRGGIAPQLNRREALLVPLYQEGASEPPLISFSSRLTEQSTAAGDMRLDDHGNLDARVTITLGSWRTAQMRTTLATTEPGDRLQFFRDMANRIFNGATDVHGEIRNEHNLNALLQIVLSCHVNRFLDLSASPLELNQTVPALGLRRMYTSSSSRRFPLYIETPLIELTTFRIKLPQNLRIARHIEPVDLHNSFGLYRLSSRELGGNTFEVTREFDIPVQVVTPGGYADFATFADHIDKAERERFVLTLDDGVEADSQSAGR